MAAKKAEVATLQAQIEAETTHISNLGAEIAGMANDLEDTKEALTQDEKFKLELESSCKTKEGEWGEICKTRAEELVALAETIKVLNDDDALDLFKKTLPSASSSFVQVTVTSSAARARALEVVRKAKSPALNFIELALSGKKIGFEKVITMIDEMVENLKKEQIEDGNKKEYCETQFDQTEDKIKELDQSVTDSDAAIKEMEGLIETLKAKIAALDAG
jgi:chromosome segregation ATPase